MLSTQRDFILLLKTSLEIRQGEIIVYIFLEQRGVN